MQVDTNTDVDIHLYVYQHADKYRKERDLRKKNIDKNVLN